MHNLPPGMSPGDPHFYDEDAPCACGHVRDEHVNEAESCVVEDCDCREFEPVEQEAEDAYEAADRMHDARKDGTW